MNVDNAVQILGKKYSSQSRLGNVQSVVDLHPTEKKSNMLPTYFQCILIPKIDLLSSTKVDQIPSDFVRVQLKL